MEFIYCPNPESDEPILLLNGEIGKGAISGAQFSKELFSLCEMGKKYISILINSSGGEVFDGYAIHSAILECQSKYAIQIDTINGGIAASIAGCFFQAGYKRIMLDYSKLMLHEPFNESGDVDKGLESIKNSLITLISKRSGLNENKVGELLADTSWINAEDALKLGLCDEIRSTEKIGKVLNKYLNNLNLKIKNKKLNMNKELLKVLNDAGAVVKDEASDEEMVDAISKLLIPKNDTDEDCAASNEVVKTEDHFAGEPTMPGVVKNDDMTKKYDELKAAYDKVMEDNMNMMKIIKDKEEKEYNDKVDRTIEDGIKAGKIQNHAVETCRLMAKADLVLFNKWLNIAPINKIAPKVVANDFIDEAAKTKNENDIKNTIDKSKNVYSYTPSLLQSKTNELMNKLNDDWNPKNHK